MSEANFLLPRLPCFALSFAHLRPTACGTGGPSCLVLRLSLSPLLLKKLLYTFLKATHEFGLVGAISRGIWGRFRSNVPRWPYKTMKVKYGGLTTISTSRARRKALRFPSTIGDPRRHQREPILFLVPAVVACQPCPMWPAFAYRTGTARHSPIAPHTAISS